MRKFFLFLLLPVFLAAQTSVDGDFHPRLRISVLTCAPGEELYSTFGHTAVRIIDSIRGTDIVYNYGTFDFDDPDFYTKFTRGKLNYFLSVSGLPEFLYEYQSENRTVTEQELNLNDKQQLLIQAALAANLSGPSRYYPYDFLYNNCTTRVRDILTRYAGLEVREKLVPPGTSFRNMIHTYLIKGNEPWSRLGIDILLGSPTDLQPGIDASMFLPDYLMKGIEAAPGLVKNTRQLNSGNPGSGSYTNWPLIVAMIACLAIWITTLLPLPKLTRILDTILFALTGLLGLFLIFMWVGTDHAACKGNYNLLWAFPPNIVAAILVWTKRRHLKHYFTATGLIYLVTAAAWFWFPQHLNPALLPLAILLLIRCIRLRNV
ncbi:MAG TPA: DUF4105 domain-containing protein [Sediminibacterium sp.]|nr:DUF4105 domain-containing protein [Sediminibacterium sp.]